jgi:hypothetical protein
MHFHIEEFDERLRKREEESAIMTTFDLNGKTVSAQSPDGAALLLVIRDELGLTGTKFGAE